MLSQEGRYAIAFNGEIYNHLELRQALEQAPSDNSPLRWRGHSDTETLLAVHRFAWLPLQDGRVDPAWVGAICFNTAAAKKDGLAPPKSWHDLLDPTFKGKIVMPDPASTRTGFLAVSAWIQLWGEAAAWAFMDRLHENVAIYTRSGGKPCRLVLRNGYRAGLSFTYMALRLKAEADGIDIIAPEEGVGWDLEATAIMRGTTKLDAARKLVDWSIGGRAARIYARRHGVFAGGEAAKPPRVFPKDMRRHMIKNDFAWAAANRLRIIAEWRRRYGGKVEPGGWRNGKEGR